MAWNSKDAAFDTVTERGFTLDSDGRQVPGVYWAPSGGAADRLVLLGHGGGADKKADYIELIAHGLCVMGVAAMAIDGPGHGDRPGADRWGRSPDDFKGRWQSDGGTAAMIDDWKVALDFIEDQHGARPTGWLGLSMGTMMGLPVCVADERIKVAVLGLMGQWGPNKADLVEAAPKLSIPVQFLVQWDDEVVPRASCLELFDALGTTKKSLHANPGLHAAVPVFEMQSAGAYLGAQLSKALP